MMTLFIINSSSSTSTPPHTPHHPTPKIVTTITPSTRHTQVQKGEWKAPLNERFADPKRIESMVVVNLCEKTCPSSRLCQWVNQFRVVSCDKGMMARGMAPLHERNILRGQV